MPSLTSGSWPHPSAIRSAAAASSSGPLQSPVQSDTEDEGKDDEADGDVDKDDDLVDDMMDDDDDDEDGKGDNTDFNKGIDITNAIHNLGANATNTTDTPDTGATEDDEADAAEADAEADAAEAEAEGSQGTNATAADGGKVANATEAESTEGASASDAGRKQGANATGAESKQDANADATAESKQGGNATSTESKQDVDKDAAAEGAVVADAGANATNTEGKRGANVTVVEGPQGATTSDAEGKQAANSASTGGEQDANATAAEAGSQANATKIEDGTGANATQGESADNTTRSEGKEEASATNLTVAANDTDLAGLANLTNLTDLLNGTNASNFTSNGTMGEGEELKKPPAQLGGMIGGAGDAMVIPILDSPEQQAAPEGHDIEKSRSMRICLTMIAAVLGVAFLFGCSGCGYLTKVLPIQHLPENVGNAGAGAGGATDSLPTVEEALDRPLMNGGEEVDEGEDGKLSECVRYSYCLPTVATLPVSLLVSVMVLSYYSSRGAHLPIITLAVAVARSFDVISDPVMSNITDGCRHAAGRRRPFMIVGAPVYAVFLVALFAPPFLTPIWLAVWYAVMYICFFLSNTFSNIPYDAWAPELTEDSNERSRLFFLSGLFDGAGSIFGFGLIFAGSRIGDKGGLTSSMCVGSDVLAEKCASGLQCADFNANGFGYEFVRNQTFTHANLLQAVDALRGHDCDEPKVDAAGLGLEADALSTFCGCVFTCKQACANANRAFGYWLTGFLFGAWYLITSYVCCHNVKERKPPPGGRPDSRPLVPSMLGVLQNPAFSALLPAWAADAISSSIFMALCSFLIMYVVAPEYQTAEDSPLGIDCKEGRRAISTSLHYNWRCSNMNVLGGCVGSALLAAVVTTPLWLLGTKKFGKVRMWLLWSLLMAATNYLFLLLHKSSLISALVFCALNGIPLAAKFLADAILADIIDYDEFLTGTRNEASYTMFKSFLPKVVAIPASALPLSIMNACGHVPPVNGMPQWQPEPVRWSVKILCGLVSGSVALLAWWIKTKYPLSTDEIVQKMGEGIALHKQGQPAADPISGHEYQIVTFTPEENRAGVWWLDHFPGMAVIEAFCGDPTMAAQVLKGSSAKQTVMASTVLVLAIGGFAASTQLLQTKQWSFVPTLMAVIVGVSTMCVGLCFLRWKAAGKLLESPPSAELVEKVRRQRQGMQDLIEAQRLAKAAKSGSAAKDQMEGEETNEQKEEVATEELRSAAAEDASVASPVFGGDTGAPASSSG